MHSHGRSLDIFDRIIDSFRILLLSIGLDPGILSSFPDFFDFYSVLLPATVSIFKKLLRHLSFSLSLRFDMHKVFDRQFEKNFPR